MHFMNRQRGRHMGAEEHGSGGNHEKPNVFVHSHKNGHTVHTFHSDGRHEMEEHGHGEAQAVADRVHESLGGASEGDEMHEQGAGLGAVAD